ncbi:MAG: hypothetical protein U0871_12475 [Gemmataceae bacterium]
MLAATLTTLFVLPSVFALVMGGRELRSASLDPFDPASRHYVPEAPHASSVLPGVSSARSASGPGASSQGHLRPGSEPPGPLAERADDTPARRPLFYSGPVSSSHSPGATAAPPQPPPLLPPAPRSRCRKLERKAVRRVVEQPGAVQAFEEAHPVAKVPGYVRAVAGISASG